MLQELYSFNRAAGVAVHLQTDGTVAIDGCILTIKQQQISINQKFVGISRLDELAKSLPPGIIIALNLSGKGILTKQVEKVEDITAQNFGLILPNASIDDFYVQNVVQGSFSFVSVIRKSEADRWFDQLHDMGFHAVTLSLGPFALISIASELNIYEGDLIFNHHVVGRTEKGEWLSYRYDGALNAPYKIKIQNEHMDEALLLPYACAFQLLLSGKIDPIKADAISFDGLFKENKELLKFKANGAILLAVFFVLLLANFLGLSWLSSSNLELSTRLSSTIQNTNQIKVNADRVKEKEAVLRGLGWDGHISKGLLIDQIASVLPADVTLTEVSVNPVDGAGTQQAKALVFFNNCINVSGTAEKVLSVNEWVARIKTKAWVKSVKLENYGFNSELNTGMFTLNITY